jgi:hypothetical protein
MYYHDGHLEDLKQRHKRVLFGLGLLCFVVGLALGYFWAWKAMGGVLN